MPDITEGGCLCGAVRFAWHGPPRWVMHCHCESCRRTCSAPFTTFVGVADDRWQWRGSRPKAYASSPGVARSFCATCGSPMAYRAERWPGETHFYAAALDNPELLRPSAHVFAAERLSWLHVADGLPMHDGTAG